MPAAAVGVVRQAEPTDREAIIALMRRCLGWPQDERAEALWAWKHEANPVGPSPVWVGEADGEVVAVRTFLRWQLRRPDGASISAVRAVDTATHPDHQGRGWFRRLTQHGLDALSAEGVACVFNTPNSASRPGYLSMGWVDQGRVPTAVRTAGLGSWLRLVRARVPADLWPDGQPSSPGLTWQSVGTALADGLAAPSATVPRGWATVKDASFLQWRYGLDLLGYRVVSGPEGLTGGHAIVRCRRRGTTRELAVLEVSGRQGAAVVERVLKALPGVSHAVALGGRPGRRWVTIPRQGPRLVARSLGGTALADRWSLSLGDVELL
jgi:GNAT superfamily N-acetyltransferase